MSIIISATQCYYYNSVKIVRIVVHKRSKYFKIFQLVFITCCSSVTVSSHDHVIILIIVFIAFMIYCDMKFLISLIPTLITSIV